MSTLVNQEYITKDAADYFKRLTNDINQAEVSIEFESYILEADHTGNAILDALSTASHRGVKIRIIIDGFGSSPWISQALNKFENLKGQIRIYHPMPWRFWQWGLAVNQQAFIKKLIFLFNVINRRNHRKVCIIDSRIHWLGSFNLSDVHLPTEMGGENWRDSAVRLVTDNDEALNAFNKTWTHKHFFRNTISSDFPVFFRINNSRKKRRRLYRDLLSHIAASEQKIWITTPYFIPEPKLLRQLKNAARRGSDVRILLPGVSDVFFMPWVSSLLYEELLKSGIQIYEYHHRVLHAKTLIIDNWATLGSSNMNSRSIMHDLEIDYVVQNQESRQLLEDHFLDDLKQSNQISVSDIQKRNPIIKLLGRLALYLRYWL